MPTNILRRHANARPHGVPRADPTQRVLRLTVAPVSIRLELVATPTADRIRMVLPIYATAERWGDSLHFETPAESGRDRTARLNASIGEVYFWTEDDRIIIPFGPTPISRNAECRLPAPCNLLARALDDVRQLKAVQVGTKVELRLEA